MRNGLALWISRTSAISSKTRAISGFSIVIPPPPIQPLRAGVLLQALGDHAEGLDDAGHEEWTVALVEGNVGAELVGGAEAGLQLVGQPAETPQADEQGEQSTGGEVAGRCHALQGGQERPLV